MILKETILSAFTERGTLLKWLKKVEAALNNDVLADVSVERINTTQFKLKFTFENGDFVESPAITLPRGDTGANGVGFDDATEISINDGAINITAGDDGVNIGASFEVAVGEEIFEIPSSMYLPFKGSESIVIDVDESGNFVEAHLDADIASKIGRSLVTPMSAPPTLSLVGVDASNAQTMIKIGDGLVIENGVLKLAQSPSETMIKAGQYRFSDAPTFPIEETQIAANVNFSLPNINNDEVEVYGNGISFLAGEGQGAIALSFTTSADPNTNSVIVYSSESENGWNLAHEQYPFYPLGFGQTFTITANTEVNPAFLSWFNANTTEVI